MDEVNNSLFAFSYQMHKPSVLRRFQMDTLLGAAIVEKNSFLAILVFSEVGCAEFDC